MEIFSNLLKKYKWYRKRKGGTWYFVVAYYEFRYWINREPLGNEQIRRKEVY